MKKNNMNETLLDLSKRQYKTATLLYKEYPSDDGIINDVAYHLQQCVELCIKYILDIENISYPWHHDIGELLRLVPPYHFKPFKEISNISDEITSLETNTRYVQGYRASLEIVKTVFSLAQAMLQEVSNIQALTPEKGEKEKREDIIWENDFDFNSPENIFCRNYKKEYIRLNYPIEKRKIDQVTQFAIRALFFANVPKDSIIRVVNELAPMIPYCRENGDYAKRLTYSVEKMDDVKAFIKNKKDDGYPGNPGTQR